MAAVHHRPNISRRRSTDVDLDELGIHLTFPPPGSGTSYLAKSFALAPLYRNSFGCRSVAATPVVFFEKNGRGEFVSEYVFAFRRCMSSTT
jgi:hypothetical protein